MSFDNRPVHEIRLGTIRASIWVNKSRGKSVWFSVSVLRIYMDDSQWRTTTSFGRDDLPIVAKAAEMAYQWIWSKSCSSEKNKNDFQ